MYIELNKENIEASHICCGFSDKKIKESYQLKKDWMTERFEKGYVFKRLDERAKVFIEYGPVESAYVPVDGENFMMLGCFWVSGKYKKQGHGKALLKEAVEAAKEKNMSGVLAIVGKKKFHFMSDGKWFLKNGFVVIDETKSGFLLLGLIFNNEDSKPYFSINSKEGTCHEKEDFVIYYSNRCPFTEYHVMTSFIETANNRGLNYKIIKLNEETSKLSPSPGTIFSFFYKGEFLTTDISICMDSRFDKVFEKALNNKK